MFIGFTPYGCISKKKRIYFEFQLLANIRSFSDGITLFSFNIDWDRVIGEHTPAFKIEFTLFNIYNHLWIYQNNYYR